MKRFGLIGIALGATAALSWGLAPPASPAGLATLESVDSIIAMGDASLRYNGAYGSTKNRLTLVGAGDGRLKFTDPEIVMTSITRFWFNPVAPAIIPNTRCTPGLGESTCNRGFYGVFINVGDGDDRVTVRRLAEWYGVYVSCGAGNDTVVVYHPRVSTGEDCERVVSG